jgi:hypothetical protein
MTGIVGDVKTGCGHSIHCEKQHKDNRSRALDGFMKIAEKVSAVVLGIFSALTDLKLFIPFFLTGMCIGIYDFLNNPRSASEKHEGSSCAHGFLEQLTGVKLPAPVSLAANVAVTICHIDHHAAVFVPIVGLSLGAWAGRMAACEASTLYYRIGCMLVPGI